MILFIQPVMVKIIRNTLAMSHHYCKLSEDECHLLQWLIQNFPEGGTNPKRVGVPTYYLTKFSPKTAWN